MTDHGIEVLVFDVFAAAAARGMRTAFIPRKEFSSEQTKDQRAQGDWTISAADLGELAERLGA
jgi:hypothetical protein